MHENEKWKWSSSVVPDCSWPYGLQPTRLLHPWDFPGKSTGVGCHCLLCPSWTIKGKTEIHKCLQAWAPYSKAHSLEWIIRLKCLRDLCLSRKSRNKHLNFLFVARHLLWQLHQEAIQWTLLKGQPVFQPPSSLFIVWLPCAGLKWLCWVFIATQVFL